MIARDRSGHRFIAAGSIVVDTAAPLRAPGFEVNHSVEFPFHADRALTLEFASRNEIPGLSRRLVLVIIIVIVLVFRATATVIAVFAIAARLEVVTTIAAKITSATGFTLGTVAAHIVRTLVTCITLEMTATTLTRAAVAEIVILLSPVAKDALTLWLLFQDTSNRLPTGNWVAVVLGAREIRPCNPGFRENRSAKVSARKLGALQRGAREESIPQRTASEIVPDKVRVVENRVIQVLTWKIRGDSAKDIPTETIVDLHD